MLAEFPGLLMNSRVPMASCSRTFWWGENKMGSTILSRGVACALAVGSGVRGEGCECDSRVGVYLWFEFRLAGGCEREGSMGAGGARAETAGGDFELVAERAFSWAKKAW